MPESGDKETDQQSPRTRRVAKTFIESNSLDAKKIAKTLLDSKISLPNKFKKTLLDTEIPATNKLKKTLLDTEIPATNKLKKTLLNTEISVPPESALVQNEVPPELASAESGVLPESASVESTARRAHFVAKTKLDHAVLTQTLLKFEVRKEARAAEEAIMRANQPVIEIPLIETRRHVRECPYVWNEANERFAHCSNCKAAIYNFDGLQLKEAEALIFTRENKSKFVLFKRSDGKFMTQDCPVAAKTRLTKFFLSVVAVAVIAGLVGLFSVVRSGQNSSVTDANNSDSVADISDGSEASRNGVKAEDGSSVQPRASSTLDSPVPKEQWVNGKRVRPTFSPDEESKYWE